MSKETLPEWVEVELARLRRQEERLFHLHSLLDMPRIQGGVLSVAHDVHRGTPLDQRAFLVRHEFRGRVREVECQRLENVADLMRGQPWQERTPNPADPLEALKVAAHPAPAKIESHALSYQLALDLMSAWMTDAQLIRFDLPDDSTPENIALAHCRLSEAYALEQCAEGLRPLLAALAAPVGVLDGVRDVRDLARRYAVDALENGEDEHYQQYNNLEHRLAALSESET